MNIIRAAIDNAVADVIAAHPSYFTDKGQEKGRALIVRKIMAALHAGGDDKSDEPEERVAELPPPFVLADPHSREARGYINLRRIAGALPPRRDGDGRVIITRASYCEAVFALADLPPEDAWPFLTEAKMIGAWMEFFRGTLLDISRRSIIQTRDGANGIFMPAYWPPSKEGRVYDQPEVAA